VTVAAIGIGSNQGDAVANVNAAIGALRRLGALTSVSRLYRTQPWGVEGQPDFINAAVLLETQLAPRKLLEALQSLEAELGRRQTYRWGPRVIDLDILYYGEERIEEPGLIVPHPLMLERQFVLAPLADIDSRYRDFDRSGYDPQVGECTPLMPEESDDITQRVRRFVDAFEQTDLIGLRISDTNGDTIELRRARRVAPQGGQGDANGIVSDGAREDVPVDVIKANLVGIAHLVKPVPAPGVQLDEGRELAYVEALGIRNPVLSRRAGRLVAVLIEDGASVEYGQPLFEIARP